MSLCVCACVVINRSISQQFLVIIKGIKTAVLWVTWSQRRNIKIKKIKIWAMVFFVSFFRNWEKCFVVFLCLGSCFCSWAVLHLGIMRGPTVLYSFYLAFSSSCFLYSFGDLVHQSVWYPSCSHLSAFLQFTFSLSCAPVTGCVSL